MKKDKISILLADDHKIVRKGLRFLLELEPDMLVVGESENGMEALALVKKLRPEVVLMDIAMPKLNGLEASRQILKTYPRTKVIILSAHADDCYIEKVVEMGVSGFLVKQCSPKYLTDAIRAVVSGETYFSPVVNERIHFFEKKELNRDGVNAHVGHSLSSREAQVLQLIVEGKANKVVAFELKISVKTVEKHRQNLMKKLGIHDVAGLTRYSISEGIIENRAQRT